MEILLNSMVKAVKLEPTFEGYGFVEWLFLVLYLEKV